MQTPITKHPSEMTDEELLTVLIGKAKRAPKTMTEAEATARQVMGEFDDSLQRLSVAEGAELEYRGTPKRESLAIAAAFELGRRAATRPEEPKPLINNPEAAYKYVWNMFAGETREVFVCILLNTAGRVITARKLTTGTLASSLVDQRATFRYAIINNAAAIIVAHNHPSGKLDPSKEDIQVTRDLKNAGEILDIPLHDHIIVGNAGYMSLKNAGYI